MTFQVCRTRHNLIIHLPQNKQNIQCTGAVISEH